MSNKNNNIPKQLDIKRILLVPVYRRKSSNRRFSKINGIDYVDTKSAHSYDNRWTAVYMKDEKQLTYIKKRYFNLFDNFKEIHSGDKASFDEFIINTNMAKPLSNYIQTSKYKYSDSNMIDKEELLYHIYPFANYIKYIFENKHSKVFYNDNNCTVEDIYIKSNNDCKIIKRKVEKHKYFAIDILTGMPISYDFICPGIPYIPKEKIMNNKDNSVSKNSNTNSNYPKSLIKMIFRK